MSGLLTCDSIFNLYTLFLREVRNFLEQPSCIQVFRFLYYFRIFCGITLDGEVEILHLVKKDCLKES